jgi:hypothetical protein
MVARFFITAFQFVARELAPAGLRSGPMALFLADRIRCIYDCCAAEREQAPSPQGHDLLRGNSAIHQSLRFGHQLL